MSKKVLLYTSILAVLAVGAIAAASALGAVEYLSGGAKLGAAETVTSTFLPNPQLHGLISGSTTLVTCATAHDSGTIEPGAGAPSSNNVVTFEKCKAELPAECKLVPAQEKEIKTEPANGKATKLAGSLETYHLEFKPTNANETFATLEFEKCKSMLNNGKHEAKGCSAAEGLGKEVAEPLLKFPPATELTGCLLKFAGNPALFLGHDLQKMTGAKKGQNFGISG